jgi:hypothetical protein
MANVARRDNGSVTINPTATYAAKAKLQGNLFRTTVGPAGGQKAASCSVCCGPARASFQMVWHGDHTFTAKWE